MSQLAFVIPLSLSLGFGCSERAAEPAPIPPLEVAAARRAGQARQLAEAEKAAVTETPRRQRRR